VPLFREKDAFQAIIECRSENALLGWLTEKQASLPLRFFWIKGYSLTAIPNHKNSLKGNIKQESITPQAVREIVKEYGTLIGNPELAAHDLRRTFAKLAHKGGAGLDQIQLSLGHLSIKTTERYPGVSQNLTDAACDHLGLGLE